MTSSRRSDAWRRSEGWSLVLVGAVALVARLALVLWAAPRFPPSQDGFYYHTLARRLAEGAGYTWLWPDGAVTYAAHYPVGYPALLAPFYALFGPRVGVAMTVNAVVGAAAAVAAYVLVREGGTRLRAVLAGLVVALHPALVPYTAAVMTEGVTAALLVVAAAFGVAARGGRGTLEPSRRRQLACWVAAGLVLGVATLVRPQSLVLAPLLGVLAVPEGAPFTRRIAGALLITGLAVGCCLPWTARNCVRMQRCALVSVNGGWNLLIGVGTTTGGWAPMETPPECKEVWSESGKDLCFERAARGAITRDPARWLAGAPAKVAMTFDYFGGAPWYLHSANSAAFPESAKVKLAAVETAACRLLLLGALVTCARLSGPRRIVRIGVAAAGAVAAVTLHAWIGYLALTLLMALLGLKAIRRAPLLVPWTAGVIAATAITHAAFFGAGRYGLVIVPLVTALAFVRVTDSSRGSPP